MSGAPGARLPRWVWFGAAVALAIHVVVLVSIVRQPLDAAHAPAGRSLVWPLYADTTHRKGPAADFFGVYDAGVQPASPQDLYVDINNPAFPPTRVPYGYPYRYLPVIAYTLSPVLRLFSPHAAYLAWIALIEATLAASLVVLWKRAQGAATKLFVAATLLVSFPYFLELHMGQFTFVAIALALAALALRERDGPPAARALGAVAFVSTVLLKLFPLVTTPALLRTRRGARLVALALGLAVVTSAVYFIGRPGALEAFASVNTGGKMDGLDAGNHGLLYVFHRTTTMAGVSWTPTSWTIVTTVWQLGLLAAVGLVVLLARRCSAVVGGALLVVAFVLSYVHVWEHHYSATILAALAILVSLERCDGGWSPRVRALAVAVALLTLPTPFVLLDPHPDPAVWDPSLGWGLWALLPPLCKALPALLVLGVGIRAVAASGFALPDYVVAWRRRRATTIVTT
ncbi:MAG TPA: glycosyltransferase 87 family protein [Polyangiaceae bacterium]|jgi:hypothetical protein